MEIVNKLEKILIDAVNGENAIIEDKKRFPSMGRKVQYGAFDSGTGSIDKMRVQDGVVNYWWEDYGYGWFPSDDHCIKATFESHNEERIIAMFEFAIDHLFKDYKKQGKDLTHIKQGKVAILKIKMERLQSEYEMLITNMHIVENLIKVYEK